MPQGLQAVFALVVLLPGFVSARIVRMMSAKNQQTELERVIAALIFSFFTYVFYVAHLHLHQGHLRRRCGTQGVKLLDLEPQD